MILIIDFGSQYNQLIARRVRENHVYCQIDPPSISIETIQALNPSGIILSGGPASIYEKNSPKTDIAIFDLGIPILGICYGMHFMISALGGAVEGVGKREYGFAELEIKNADGIFHGVSKKSTCWMSHGDSVIKLSPGFKASASTDTLFNAVIENKTRKIYAVQFHPEKSQKYGIRFLKNFLEQ